MESRPSIDSRWRPLLDRINEGRQFGAQRFFWRKFQLVHRAFLRFYRVAISEMSIFERFDFVLCHVVIAHRGAIRPANDYFAKFAWCMVSCFYRREYRRTVALIVFQDNQRFVVHSAAQKITQNRMNAPWRRSRRKLEKNKKRKPVAKGTAGAWPGPLKPAKPGAPNLTWANPPWGIRSPIP